MTETWPTTKGDHVTLFTRLTLRGLRWRWHCTAGNGEIVEHGQSYSRRIDAVTAAERHHPRVES
jgi:hypothetical protein